MTVNCSESEQFLLRLSAPEQTVPGGLGPGATVLEGLQGRIDHLELLAVVQQIPAAHESRRGQVAAVRHGPVEIVAVEACVEVGPTTLADLTGTRPAVACPNRPALEALLQVSLLFSSLRGCTPAPAEPNFQPAPVRNSVRETTVLRAADGTQKSTFSPTWPAAGSLSELPMIAPLPRHSTGKSHNTSLVPLIRERRATTPEAWELALRRWLFIQNLAYCQKEFPWECFPGRS